MRVNNHHLFFQKRHYRSNIEKAFRNHEGLVIPTLVTAHEELHANMFPPPKPNRDLMLGIMNNLEGHHLRSPLDGLLYTIEYVEDRHERLANHLYEQLGHLSVNEVGVEYAA